MQASSPGWSLGSTLHLATVPTALAKVDSSPIPKSLPYSFSQHTVIDFVCMPSMGGDTAMYKSHVVSASLELTFCVQENRGQPIIKHVIS